MHTKQTLTMTLHFHKPLGINQYIFLRANTNSTISNQGDRELIFGTDTGCSKKFKDTFLKILE